MNKSGLSLIDKAAKVCGSDAALARKLGTKPPAISEMRAGKREISPETAALLADIAHEDAREAVIQAVIERNRTGPKAETIRAILGKGLAAGVAAVWVFSYSKGWTGAIQTVANSLNQLHIV
ncbi:MAG: helix-turn-helix domain-containing protein [Ottowia sp.]